MICYEPRITGATDEKSNDDMNNPSPSARERGVSELCGGVRCLEGQPKDEYPNTKRREKQMTIAYQVTFRPGRYKCIKQIGANGPVYMIGRDDDGKIIGWAFEEESTKHITLALNLVDAYVTKDTDSEREILKALNKLRGH